MGWKPASLRASEWLVRKGNGQPERYGHRSVYLSEERYDQHAQGNLYVPPQHNQGEGYTPKQQNVSINIRVGSYDVDLVPAKHQGGNSDDHSLYRRRADTWTQTNVVKHIAMIRNAGRISESRVLKLWRNQKQLDLPSFYLELTTISALSGGRGTLSDNVWAALEYLRDRFPNARVVDPANTNNIISDDLSAADKAKISAAAAQARKATDWNQIVT